MNENPRKQISELEVQIEELAAALERCRKTALASKAAMGLGGILLAATILGVVTFDPMAMVAGLALLLGGVVIFGSNTSTANQLSESMRNAEAMRAGLIGRLDLRLVEDRPPKAGLRIDDAPKRSKEFADAPCFPGARGGNASTGACGASASDSVVQCLTHYPHMEGAATSGNSTRSFASNESAALQEFWDDIREIVARKQPRIEPLDAVIVRLQIQRII